MPKSFPHDAQTESKKAHLIAHHRELMNSWSSAQDVFTRLCRRLHTSLELDNCLSIFLEELHSVMAFNSFSYQHEHGQNSYIYAEGFGGQHQCEYNLSLQGEPLGYLKVTRRSRFAEEELAVLEQLIGILVFPLRNCWNHRQVWDAALTDSITRLGNKRALLAAIERSILLSRRHTEPVSLLLCDLDHFKKVNDSHGHVFGDRMLGAIAEVISNSIRSSDQAFRFGGEEFAVLLPHTALEEATIVAERIRQAIEQHQLLCEGHTVKVTASLGVAQYDNNAAANPADSDGFIESADEALYRAKDHGRNAIRKAQLPNSNASTSGTE